MPVSRPLEPAEHGRPIEEWTDAELLDQYRFTQAEIADEDSEYLQSDDSPLAVLEAEIERRGLEAQGEAVEPDASSPGREARDQLAEGGSARSADD